MAESGLNFSRRIRRTPYTDRVEAAGVRGFSVVNHMLLPKAYGPSVEADYWHLRNHVQLWDVAVQRQVELHGPDAAKLVQLMTPRDISGAIFGQGLYLPLIDDAGGMLNDPVLLRLAPDRFWLSIADSDILLWAKGLAIGYGLEVRVSEPDISPLAIQGPKAAALMADMVGPAIHDLGYFQFDYFTILGTPQIIARSGYSKQGGYEIYWNDSTRGGELWDAVYAAGQPYDIRPGCPNLIERIEGGLLSYGNEFTRENNPLECGLGGFCALDTIACGGTTTPDYIGKTALEQIAKTGITQQIRGILFGRKPCPPCAKPFPVYGADGTRIGQITSGIYSPRFERNVGLSMIARSHWDVGTPLKVAMPDGTHMEGEITSLPFPA